MARPMATDKEMNRLRKEGKQVTEQNLRILRAQMRKEAAGKAEKRNMAAGKAANGKAAAKRAVTEPAGFNKGGMVKKKASKYANCGASVPASRK